MTDVHSEPQATGIIAPSATAAQAEQDRRRGPHMRLKPGRTYRLRLMPAYKVEAGEGIWYSVARKHWKIPVLGTDDKRTFSCPRELSGASCYMCDMVEEIRPTMPALAKDFAPNLSYMFNVLDCDSPQFGVQQLEDGATLFNLFLAIVKATPTISDPIQGQVITVEKLTGTPWRTAIPGAVLSYDELGVETKIAFAENLTNLDEAWNFMDYAEQQQLFAAIKANPQLAATQAQAGAIPAALPALGVPPVIATSLVPAPVPVPVPVPAPGPAPAPVAVVAPVVVAAPVPAPMPTTAPAPLQPAVEPVGVVPGVASAVPLSAAAASAKAEALQSRLETAAAEGS